MCGAPGYLEKHPAPRNPADLRDHNCLLYAYSIFDSDWYFLDADGNPVFVRVSGNLVSTSVAAIPDAALAGIGLWLAPTSGIASDLSVGVLVPVLRGYRTPEMEIVALYPDRRHTTPKVRAFIDMLAERFANEQHRFDAVSGSTIAALEGPIAGEIPGA